MKYAPITLYPYTKCDFEIFYLWNFLLYKYIFYGKSIIFIERKLCLSIHEA